MYYLLLERKERRPSSADVVPKAIRKEHAHILGKLSRFSTRRICSREQAKSDCDWLMMTSVFVASQSSCFFLCTREQIRQVENRLYSNF